MAKQSTKPSSVSMTELVQLTGEKDYVPQAAGLAEGAKGRDVERLQRYLQEFGYSQGAHLESFGVDTSALAEPPAKSGVFDGHTADALKEFQRFNGLTITGQLDDATRALMTQPRCGFPDVAEFVLQGSKWTRNNLTYGFQNFTVDLTPAQVRAAIVEAFGLWSAVTPLSFAEVPMSGSPDIVIRFVAGNHGDGSNFDGPSGVLAHAYYPPPGGGALAGDTHFDEAETWSITLPASGIDLATVAAHEFGHALGLAHSNTSGALMYAYYGGPHRRLEADDVAGIQALYGARQPQSRWRGWEDLGGLLTSGVGVSSWAANRLDTFVRGTDNRMWHKWWNGAGWLGWENLGGVLTSGIGVSSWAANRLDCFVRGTDNRMWHKWWNGSSWIGWENLGGVLTSAPAAVSWGPNRIDTFVRGTDNHMWHKWWNGASWSGWEDLGGILTSEPAAVSWGPGRIDTFVRGTDNHMWHKWYPA